MSIQIRDLNVNIGSAHILKNINLEIQSNQITCIIGPSGCGKSTLLKSINRLIDQNNNVHVTGNIMVEGENIYGRRTEVTHIRRKMGLVSQRPTPLPMSIYDNVAYGCRLHGHHSKRELDAIVERTLTQADLWNEVRDRLSAPASALSIGQQQRLCLARGLAVQPHFILGDESTSALDPIASRHVENLFVSLKSDYGVVLVTHTLSQARRIADNVIFMYLGEVIEAGSADEVFNHPKQELTKEYLAGAFS
ncbi:MAG: phosphate ABC transporter ATP-binding protein [Bacteroidales bacterium]|nr:phosphate ABC transporter ATP-binding protein [Bacteroidales bacterium]